MSPPLKTTGLTLICALALCSVLRAERWQLRDGEAHEGDIVDIYGPLVVVSAKHQTRFLNIERLDAAGIGRVADHLAKQPAAPIHWRDSQSVVAKALHRRLQVWDATQGKLVTFDPGERPEPEFYLAYFSAHWCGPCREFTPELVKAYRELKADPAYASLFELVFISSDRDAAEQKEYIQEVDMPWPLVKYSHLGRVDALERWAGRGIPCLVVVSRSGEALFHSYHGETYVGPEEVLKNFCRMLPLLNPRLPASRRALHNLAVEQHVRASATGAHPPKPYVMHLDPAQYQKLPETTFEARLAIDASGHVTIVSTTPALPAVYTAQFRRDAESWLFLPAIRDGQPVATEVNLPVKF